MKEYINQSFNQLATSLPVDLGNFSSGFKSLSEVPIGNITKLDKINQLEQRTTYSEAVTSHHEEKNLMKMQYHQSNIKKCILGTNEDDRSIAAANSNSKSKIANASYERRKSIVFSNIETSMNTDYLTNYLANKLQIEGEKIRVTLLTNNRDNNRDYSSLQYRISTPEDNYEILMTPNTWPLIVRIRDYISSSNGAKVFP